jgi:hypothetical protein
MPAPPRTAAAPHTHRHRGNAAPAPRLCLLRLLPDCGHNPMPGSWIDGEPNPPRRRGARP